MGSVSSSTKAAKDDRSFRITSAKAVDDVLNQIASRARAFTNSDGAAIALNDGDSMVTRASTGGIAPDVGSRLRTEGTFSGLCLKQGTALHCEDAQTDARVDAEACRALNTRSFIVVPIAGANAFIGLLAVFSSSARWFTQSDATVLATMAEQVTRTLGFKPEKPGSNEHSQISERNLRAAADVPSGESPARPPDQGSALFVVGKSRAGNPDDEGTTIDVTGQFGATEGMGSAHHVEASASERNQPAPVAEAAAPVDVPEAPATEILLPTLVMQAAASSKEPGEEGSSRKWLAAGSVIIIVASAFTWVFLLRSPQQTAATSETAARSEAVAEPPASAAASQVAAKPSTTEQLAPLQVLAQQTATPAADSARRRNGKSTEPAPAEGKRRPEGGSDTAPIVLAPVARAPEAEATSNEAAPQLAFATGKPALPEAVPALPVAPLASRELVPSELIYTVAPRYPSTGSKFGLRGTVVLRATVLTDGSVGAIKVIRGGPPFVAAAVAAVKQWRYKPARVNGTPVDSMVEVTVKFDRTM